MGLVELNMGGGRKQSGAVCDHPGCRVSSTGLPGDLRRRGWKIKFFRVLCPAHA